MKKNVLALSITAAVASFGLIGGANAMIAAPLTGAVAATSLALNEAGVGHSLFIPYFTAQDSNSTLINLVNTDRVNGKAVKIRFRGAANSDDLFDFQVFLSPGDVWTAAVSKGSDGYAKLTTTDASCTKPDKTVLNATPFKATRLDTANLTGDALPAGTREGYVEIFNMGDIPRAMSGFGVAGTTIQDHSPEYTATGAVSPVAGAAGDNFAGVSSFAGGLATNVNALYTAIKHVSKVAPCAAATAADGSGNAFTALDTADLANETAGIAKGLLAPTTGLMANWTIINVVGAAAWAGQATAIQSIVTATGVASRGNMIYWPQTGTTATTPDNFTADPLLRSDAQKSLAATGTGTAVAGAAIPALFVDLPDMSTPYSAAAATGIAGNPGQPLNQAAQLTLAIATKSITNEFLTDPAISGSTDWVFSMPTRRYSTAFNYTATISAVPATFDDGRRFSEILDDGAPATLTLGYFTPANTIINQVSATNVNGRQICVTGITRTPYDREETTPSGSTGVVISPAPVTPTVGFCGEASVLSINNGGTTSPSAALKSTVTRNDATLAYVDGWMRMGTPGASTTGLPVLGAAFAKAIGGTSTFGATWQHRYAR